MGRGARGAAAADAGFLWWGTSHVVPWGYSVSVGGFVGGGLSGVRIVRGARGLLGLWRGAVTTHVFIYSTVPTVVS